MSTAPMIDCRQLGSFLPPFVDGEADARTTQSVETHLASCPGCHYRVAAERTARAVLRARRSEIADLAPPGLRTRIEAVLAEQRAATVTRLGWGGRLTAFASAAATIILVVAGLELVNPRSTVLYAAQLAIDHMRCFVVEMTSVAPADAQELKRDLARKYGWSIEVPPSNAEVGVTLVAARRCPFWIGPHAHLLYRTGDREVSLYVTPGETRAVSDLHVLGHAEKVWTSGGTSYAMVAGGLAPDQLARIGAYLHQETTTN